MHQQHLCKGRKARSWLSKIVQATQPLDRQPGSNQGSIAASGNSSQGHEAPVTGRGISAIDANKTGTNNTGPTTPVANPQTYQTTITVDALNEAFVLLGVKGKRRTLEMVHIDAKRHAKDGPFSQRPERI